MWKHPVAVAAAAAFIASTMACRSTTAADIVAQDGVVVCAGQNTLVIADAKKKKHSYRVGNEVPVRINGKSGKLEDLKKRALVIVTVDKKGDVRQVVTIDLQKRIADSRRYWR